MWRLWVEGIFSYWADKIFLVNVPVTLTFVLVSSKSIESIYLSLLTSMPSMKTVDQRNINLLGDRHFLVNVCLTLTFDPVTSKSIGVI
jgi:hypothetical protein